MKNVKDGLQAPYFPISTILNGPESICENTNTTYSFSDICKLPSTATWSVDGNLEIINSTDTNVTVKGLYNGNATITAIFSNGQKFTKTLWVGVPQFNEFTFDSGQHFTQCLAPVDQLTMSLPGNRVTALFQGMSQADINTNSNWEWQTTNNLIMLNPTNNQNNNRSICPMDIGYSGFRVRAKNACGWSEWYEIPEFQITSVPYTGYFRVSPNPTSGNITIDLKDKTKKPKNNTNKTAKLYDNLGNQKAVITITDDKASVSINNLPTGVYHLKINVDNKMETHTIIKN